MGCDIHIITEIKKNNKWQRVPEVPKAYDYRDYSVFAFLANVRNDWNHTGFEPKGLPEDISSHKFERNPEWDDEGYEYYKINFDCEDYHSHSWLTLAELQNADISDFYLFKCKIIKAFYDKFVALGGVMPEGITIDAREPEESSLMNMIRYAAEPVVVAQWKIETDRKHPVEQGIIQLAEIADRYGVSPENIRIVFAFDN